MSVESLYGNLSNYVRQGLLVRVGKGGKEDPYRYRLTRDGLVRLHYLEEWMKSLSGERMDAIREYYSRKKLRKIRKNLAR